MNRLCFIDEHTPIQCDSPRQVPILSHLLVEKNMNAKYLIATVALFAAGSAFADQIYPYSDFSGFQGTKTRAEVTAELNEAHAQGNYVAGGTEFVAPDAKFASTKTRAEVIAELEQSKTDGSYALAHQEYEGQYPALQTGANSGTRLAGKTKGAKLN